jgi:hypothetical protein
VSLAPGPAPKRAARRLGRVVFLAAVLLAAGLLVCWATVETARRPTPAGVADVAPPDVDRVGVPQVEADVVGPEVTLRGVVEEEDGGPAVGALVVCEGCLGEEGAGEAGHLMARTDGEGRFLLPVTVAHGQRFRLVAKGHETQGWAEAGRVGEPARVRLSPASQVRGRVLGPERQPVPGAVVVFSEPLLSPVQLVTGLDGSFSGPVLPGLYQVTVVLDASQPRRTWTVQVPQDGPLELSIAARP